MADTKTTALSADASPTTDDLVMTVNDPGGTPANRKVTLAALMTLAGKPLETQTAADSAALNFTTCISSSFDEYRIEIVGLQPATDGDALWFRVSTDGGSSYVEGTAYDTTRSFNSSAVAGGAGAAGVEGDSKIILAGPVDSEATAALNGTMTLFNPLSTTLHKQTHGTFAFVHSSDADRYRMTSTGWWRATTAVTAFRFLFSTGNIAAGTIRVYGVPKT